MKHYSGCGDKGSTDLANGLRTEKDDLRLEVVGTLDELNSHIGWLAAKAPAGFTGHLEDIQRSLFAIGAHTIGATHSKENPITQAIEAIEAEIAHLGAGPEMSFRGFILPGGEESAALAHVCRTICRRAERRYVSLLKNHPEAPTPQEEKSLVYLNRLSSYFYVLAKKINNFYQNPEINL